MADQVQEIKDRLNIVDVVGQYVQLTRAGKNFHAKCPFHKERTPSFNVSPERGSYMCFGCGEKGDIFSFIERIEGIDFKTALEQLAEKAGVKLVRHTPQNTKEEKDKDERLREVCEAATNFYEVVLHNRQDVLDYLYNRGVTEESIKSWRLGYAPARWQEAADHLVSVGFTKDEIAEAGIAAKSERKPGEVYDRFRGRIMFPINDPQGRVIAFSGRFFEKVEGSKEEGEPAKYVNSPETVLFKKSRIMYGFDHAKTAIRKADCALLVEGQFDLVLSHQSGLPFTVAISGTALTTEHLSLLGRLTKRVVLALDADQAGIRSGLKSAHMALQAGFDVKVPTFPFGKDPADVARENPELLKQAIRTSQTAVEFFLEALRHGAKDEREYKHLVEVQVLPLIAVLPSKIEQEHFIRIVASKLSVAESAVREEVSKRKVLAEVHPVEVMKDARDTYRNQLDPLEKKVAMLLSYFAAGSPEHTRLLELWGKERVASVEERILGQDEVWRFRFEQELHGEVTPVLIANDMLADIGRRVAKERIKMQFL